MFKVIMGLLIVVFLLFLYCACKLASIEDAKKQRNENEENQNEERK